MSRTNTASFASIKLDRPGNNVVSFQFPTDDKPGHSILTIPSGSKWTAQPHWHESYTEYLRVIKGRLRVHLDGEVRVVQSKDGDVTVPRHAIHDFMREDIDVSEEEGDEGDVVVEEWVDQIDGFKEAFFRNLGSTIYDEGRALSGPKMVVQILSTCAHFDNYNVFVNGKTGWYVTHAIFGIATAIGSLIGLQPWYEEYTPARLRKVASSGGAKKQKSV